ncbi:hypothetical protein B7P43_G14988 [Cryptotermes secundus]|nr:hypothetical protein B7P43_G14988 [Cryptotermes secundus]
MTALAACSRSLSATMDYISGGRCQQWIQAKIGSLPSVLGGHLPDFMALAVTAVPSVLFMLGLEHSMALQLLLNISLAVTVMFFVIVGSLKADISNWTGQNFMAAGSSGVLTGTAICSFGFLSFIGIMPQSWRKSQGRRQKVTAAGAALLVMFVSYSAVAVVVSLMVQFQAVKWSPVPLLHVFEVRDVDWARLVMASLSILGLALALLEVCTPLHTLVVRLAGDEWQVLPHILARENSSMGTPILAILAAGLPASLLACVCPLWLLVRVMCVGPLVDHAVMAATVIHKRYQPHTGTATDNEVKYCHVGQKSTSVCHPHDEFDEFDEDDMEAGQKQHRLTVRCLKSGLGFLPAAIRQHVSSGPDQQYYTSLSSPCSLHGDITNLSSATLSSESITVTYIDPDDISLAEGNVIPSQINCSLSNETAVTSLSCDLATQGQVDKTCNGSVKSIRSLESKIMNQSEVELRNVTKSPSSVRHMHNDMKVVSNGSIMSSESVLSARNHSGRGSAGPLLSVNNDEQDRRAICNGSVKSSTAPVNYNDRNLVIGDEELVKLGSESGTFEYCEEHNSADDTGSEDTTLSSASTCDESDSSTTDIDAIVAEYKEKIKVATAQPIVCAPTAATGRRVTLSLIGVLVCVSVVGVTTVLSEALSAWCGSLGLIGALFLLAVIAQQPQNDQKTEGRVPLVPWLPASVVLINAVLGSQLIATVWLATVIWMPLGFILYWRKRGLWRTCNRPGVGGSDSSRREHIRLHAPPRNPTVSTLIPSHHHLPDERFRRLTQVDTILISR